MIIDDLPVLPSKPATGDELAIERGELAYKVTYNNLVGSEIAGVKSNITTLQGNVTTLQNADSKIESSIAIIVNGNTTSTTIAEGQYVYIKGSTVLAEGLYTAITAVPSGTVITAQTAATYFTAVSWGGLNAIKQTMALQDISSQLQTTVGTFVVRQAYVLCGVAIIAYEIKFTKNISSSNVIMSGLPHAKGNYVNSVIINAGNVKTIYVDDTLLVANTNMSNGSSGSGTLVYVIDDSVS